MMNPARILAGVEGQGEAGGPAAPPRAKRRARARIHPLEDMDGSRGALFSSGRRDE